MEYICKALSNQPVYVWYAAGSSPVLTSVVISSTNTATVTTAAAHGLAVGNRVQISGVTTDTDLNGSYAIVSVPSATTFTVTTANITTGVTFNGASDAAMVMATNAPRTTASVWSIQRNFYTTTYPDRTAWAEGTTATINICANRTAYAYN